MPTLEEMLILDQLSSEVEQAGFSRFDIIESFLQSEDWVTRSTALGLVSKIKSPPARLVQLAEKLLTDDNYTIRMKAARAIYFHLPREHAISVLSRHDDPHSLVQTIIASYLRSLTQEAQKGNTTQ
jgi:hypothetical protein